MNEIEIPFFWHTYESYDKQEVIDFFNKIKPDIYKMYIRHGLDDLETPIYVLKWLKDEEDKEQ